MVSVMKPPRKPSSPPMPPLTAEMTPTEMPKRRLLKRSDKSRKEMVNVALVALCRTRPTRRTVRFGAKRHKTVPHNIIESTISRVRRRPRKSLHRENAMPRTAPVRKNNDWTLATFSVDSWKWAAMAGRAAENRLALSW